MNWSSHQSSASLERCYLNQAERGTMAKSSSMTFVGGIQYHRWEFRQNWLAQPLPTAKRVLPYNIRLAYTTGSSKEAICEKKWIWNRICKISRPQNGLTNTQVFVKWSYRSIESRVENASQYSPPTAYKNPFNTETLSGARALTIGMTIDHWFDSGLNRSTEFIPLSSSFHPPIAYICPFRTPAPMWLR